MKFIKYTIIALFFAACHAEPEMIEEITPLVHTRASSLQFTQTENINLKELGIIRPSKLIRKDSLYSPRKANTVLQSTTTTPES